MFENWQHVIKHDFFHYLKVPHFVRDDSLDYFEEELALMCQAICEHFEVDINEQKLSQAIATYDDIQAKLKKLYELRERSDPAVSGAEVMRIICTGSSMRGEDFNALLDKILAEKAAAKLPASRARMILLGSATDEIDLVADMESQGAFIATDALCFGSRSFWSKSGESTEPVRLLAEKYLSNLFCPRMFAEYDKRREFILQTAERANVDGAVIVYNKFCDLHGVEAVSLRMDLEKNGIPVLVLEKDYGSKADSGRIKTRVQAFLERIGG
ncbi:MAG: hypothetical protein A2W01_02870 [Candidatus Solincola sediminis]|nr:MAG: hypothetical protein A2W01_02870 [Candidatus Solincola sediminis]